ncbi:MAG: M23 family metallopeptidase [Chitinophagaceae bacterium]|nr:M23 family metallopeptidase [Chitinophagaceae bacterium]
MKSCADGIVATVQRDPDGTYGIVYSYEDFWFWISGVQQPLVRAQQRIKKGEVIGKLTPGVKLEILLFDFETPADPAAYLPCFQNQDSL